MTEKILFSAPFSFIPAIREGYEAVLPTIFREIWTKDDLKEGEEDVIAWMPNPGQNFVADKRVLSLFPNLQVIVTPSTGTNHIDRAACEQKGIAVYSLLDDRMGLETISASAEFSFLLLLNTLRGLHFAIEEVNAGRWRHREDDMRGNELYGKEVGLVGLGRIGRRLARYSSAFEANVSFTDPFVENKEYQKKSIEQIFEESDVVCVCTVLNEDTIGLVNYDLLQRLKPHARLVNSSRGEVMDEAALIRILQERDDIRVGLDVLTGETLNTHLQSPLIEMHKQGRIVITPHIAGATVESQAKAAQIALGLFKNHQKGQ